MSDNSKIIKEAQDYLEDAQKEVLKTLNSQSSFLARLFKGSAKANLKMAQSAISKAINQIKNIIIEENNMTSKLQKNLSKKDDKIKELENLTQKQEQEISNLKDQQRQLEAKLKETAKTQNITSEVKQRLAEEKTMKKQEEQLENKLENTLIELKEKNTYLENRLKQSIQELQDSNALALEFSTRMKRLKAEVTTSK